MKEKNNGTLFGKAEWVSWWMEYLGRFQGQKPKGRRTKGFWPKDLPRDSIHHDSLSKVFPYNIISFSSQTSTSREEFISANGLIREYHGQYTGHDALHIGRAKSQYTIRDVKRMGIKPYLMWTILWSRA